MKVKGTIKFTFRQALKVLICSIFKVEMDVEIDAEKIVKALKPPLPEESK